MGDDANREIERLRRRIEELETTEKERRPSEAELRERRERLRALAARLESIREEERTGLMGGDIAIEGAPGRGTTVRVRIPLNA